MSIESEFHNAADLNEGYRPVSEVGTFGNMPRDFRTKSASDVARLEQLLREKDDMLAAQFRELAECRRHLAMAQEGITHWRARALAAEDQP